MIYQLCVDWAKTRPQGSFWPRQFSPTVTARQIVFDVIFGSILPVLCFTFDPIVFSGGTILGPPMLINFKAFVYTLSAISMLALTLWLTRKHTSHGLHGLAASVLCVGALTSLMLGILLLPLSIFGLVFVIGVLGFIPFLTAFTYLRNATRAFAEARVVGKQANLVCALVLGASLTLILPASIQLGTSVVVKRSQDELLRGGPDFPDAAVSRLRLLADFADTDEIVRAYTLETDARRRGILARAYLQIKGEEIESRKANIYD